MDDKVYYLSIWAGNFSSEEQLSNYLTIDYDDQDDECLPSSQFMIDFGIDYYDTDFQDVCFSKEITELEILLEEVSYASSFVNKLSFIKEKYNAAIVVYDFEYKEDRVSSLFNFIGIFEYRKD